MAVLALSITARALTTTRKAVMNVATMTSPTAPTPTVSTPTVRHAPVDNPPGLLSGFRSAALNFYYGDNKALKNITLPLYARQGDGFHRSIRLRQVHPAAHPHGCTTFIRTSAPRAT